MTTLLQLGVYIYIIYRIILLLDQEPPVFTYCPSDIVMDNLTSFDVRINWQQPTVNIVNVRTVQFGNLLGLHEETRLKHSNP